MKTFIPLLTLMSVLVLSSCASAPPPQGNNLWIGAYLDNHIVELVNFKGQVRITTNTTVYYHGNPVTSFTLWLGQSFTVVGPRTTTRLTLRSTNDSGITLTYVTRGVPPNGSYETVLDQGTIVEPWRVR